MADADFDVSSYTKKDLLKILGFKDGDKPTQQEISDNIKKLKGSTTNPEVINFFSKMSDRLLKGEGQLDESTDMFQTEYSSQSKDDDQLNLRTNRFQQVHVNDDEDENFVMFRNKLNVASQKPTTILQGSINPNMRNTTSRHVNIDSQFRKEIFRNYGTAKSSSVVTRTTDFVLEFTEHLTNVLNIKLQSINIPTTWYAFSEALGNICMEIEDKDEEKEFFLEGNEHSLPKCGCIKEGNPESSQQLMDWLNDEFGDILHFSIDPTTNKVKIENKTMKNLRLFFYRPSGFGSYLRSTSTALNNTPCGKICKKPSFVNHNLGWELGFRIPPDVDTEEVYIDIPARTLLKKSFIEATAVVNISGPKYFTLAIDDFNQNHLNKGLINILEKDEHIDLPEYYNPAEEDYKDKDDDIQNNNVEVDDLNNQQNLSLACTELRNKKNAKYPFVRKSIDKPRKLTSAQIYSINEIIKNRHRVRSRVPPPGISNTFANITLLNIASLRKNHEPYSAYGSSLQFYSREYFGPVHIRKMRVTLYDDKGNIVDLNGHDWSFTLIVEMLYQY
ncbi:MAG: hypothetical protein CL847_04025 [Crocinitomicaceae bacterium]|nr:hypothetical protein [Crocinitomicaceae bacterium]|tara:strand:+ start:3089 stop:4762 length:1674 start_codon:yes stop_codon:yes gene_type:complete